MQKRRVPNGAGGEKSCASWRVGISSQKRIRKWWRTRRRCFQRPSRDAM